MMALDLRSPRLGFWVLLLGCLFVCAPTTYPGYWKSQEGFVPIFNAAQPGDIAMLATTPDLWRGTGRGAFLLAQPLMLLGAAPVVAVRITFALALVLGGLGVYVWLHPRLGDRAAGLAGVIYLLLPPILATVYMRGSLGDALIVGLLPLALAGLATYSERHSMTAALVVVLSMLWMWRSQAGLALLATLLLIVYAAVVERSRLALLVAAVSGAAGFSSVIPLWSIQGPSPVRFADHFLNLAQLFVGNWQSTPATVAWQVEPFQLGFAAIAFNVLAIWLWMRRTSGQRGGITGRLLGFSWIGILVILLLSLQTLAPFWSVTQMDRLLTYPWQVLLLASPLLAVTAGSLPALNVYLQRAPLWLTLVGLVLLSSYPYFHADYTEVQPPDTPVATFGLRPDLVLLHADLVEDEATGEATLDVTWQVLQPLAFDYSVFFQAVVEEEGESQVVAQLDTQPRQGLEPATSWVQGQILTDTYQLELPNSLPAGELRYIYGYYDWRDGSRVPVNGGIDDKLILYGE